MCFYELFQRSKHSLLIVLVHFLDESLGGADDNRNQVFSPQQPKRHMAINLSGMLQNGSGRPRRSRPEARRRYSRLPLPKHTDSSYCLSLFRCARFTHSLSLSLVDKSPMQCAGLNRHEAGNARVLRERSSEPLGPEFCVGHREVHGEA